MSGKYSVVVLALAAGSLLTVGCATKGYVRKSVEPVDQKVQQVDQSSQKRDADQVAAQTKTSQELEEDEKKLDATGEVARTADSQSKDALGKTAQNAKSLGDLRSNVKDVVANIDDYKPAGQETVHFKVNQHTLSKDERAKLDDIATKAAAMPRYFITVEGYTDQTGSKEYNDQLSRERANQVISYLVGTHNIPVYRVHMIGLGDQKLVDNGKGRQARQASRRVEVTIFSAKPLTVSDASN